MTNLVTLQLELNDRTATAIQAAQAVMNGDVQIPTAETPAPAKETKAPAKETKAPASKAPAKEESTGPTLAEVKEAAKKAKSEHGEEFAKSVLDDLGVKAAASLGRRMGAIDEDIYQEVIDRWSAGPVTEAGSDEDLDDDLDDDEDDDLEDEAEVSVDAVKEACKAYSKGVGKADALAIMKKHGAASLSAVGNLSASKLASLFKELNEGL